jgi:bacterioferritin-associated ferredoxin
MYVCLCKGIREAEFEDIVVRNDAHAECVKRAMGLDESCCGRCEESLEDMIQDIGFARCPRI